MLNECLFIGSLQLPFIPLFLLPPLLLLEFTLHLVQVHLLQQLLFGSYFSISFTFVCAFAIEIALGFAVLGLALKAMHSVLRVVLLLCVVELVTLIKVSSSFREVCGSDRASLALVLSEVSLLLPIGDEGALVAGVFVVGVHAGGVGVDVHFYVFILYFNLFNHHHHIHHTQKVGSIILFVMI